MKTAVPLLLVALFLALAHSEVVVLDDSNFTAFVQEHPYVFVKFYAPWFGHCKAMAPDYKTLGEASEGKEYVIAEVDSTTSPNITEEVGVDGYPTLKLIVQGQPLDYSGERTLSAMQKWLEESLNVEIPIISEDKVKELIGTTDFLLIQGASEEQLKFLRFAKADKETNFYAIKGGDFKVTLYLKNTRSLEYNGELKLKDISSWVFQSTLSALIALKDNEAIKYVFENRQKLPAFLLLKSEDWKEELSGVLLEFCEANRANFVCSWASKEHDVFAGVSRFLKSKEGQSELAFFDYGIKNGWKVPNHLEITSKPYFT
jgi:protein disulfide-isomerase-like protein